MLADESTPLFETLHKHPNNSVPSRDDIRKLFEKPRQTGSTISCHDGTVYRIGKIKEFKNIDVFSIKFIVN